MSELVRVVSKVRYNEQHFVSIPQPSKPLEAFSVRVRTIQLGLSSNNLSYCLGGEILHWWSAFPIPAGVDSFPSSEYGVSPGWGIGRVTESTIKAIEKGRLVWGMLPISAHSFDLQLRQSELVPSDFIETSAHRSKLFNMYQRYSFLPADTDPFDTFSLWRSVLKFGEAGALLAKFVFPQDGSEPIHPLGAPVSPWTASQSEVRGSCIICLASGTKTAREFIYTLANISETIKPEYTLIEVTSDSQGCARYLKSVPFQHKVMSYEALSEQFPAFDKFILLDFGGRNGAVAKAAESIKGSHPDSELIVVSIGGEAKVYDGDQAQERRTRNARLKAFQMNATGIRDAAMTRKGEAAYFNELYDRFAKLVAEQTKDFDGKVLDVTLKQYSGLEGVDGLEGVWDSLCKGKVSGNDGIVVRFE